VAKCGIPVMRSIEGASLSANEGRTARLTGGVSIILTHCLAGSKREAKTPRNA
jgi:hypothetical protein